MLVTWGSLKPAHLGVSGAELLRCHGASMSPENLVNSRSGVWFLTGSQEAGVAGPWAPPSVAGEQFHGQSMEQMVSSLHFLCWQNKHAIFH